MVNTQLLRVQNVHTKYRKYFRGFLNSRLLKNREIRENKCTVNISASTVIDVTNNMKFNVKFTDLMFSLIQYFSFYSVALNLSKNLLLQ